MINKIKLLSVSVIAALMLSGCANDYVRKYYDINSYAYNTAYTGGVKSGLKDRSAPKGGVGNFTQTVEFGAAYTAAGFAAPALGMSNLAGGAVNLLDMLIDDGPDASRNNAFAWMPLSKAQNQQEAQQKLKVLVKEAMEQSLKTMGLDYSPIEHNDPTFVGFYIHNENLNCPKDVVKEKWHTGYFFHPVRTSACTVRASINRPLLSKTADVRMTKHTEERSYFFVAGNKSDFNAILVSSPASSSLPENQLYNEISKNLPEWMFIYLAPGKVTLADGNAIGFPHLLNQGESHFFVRPD